LLVPELRQAMISGSNLARRRCALRLGCELDWESDAVAYRKRKVTIVVEGALPINITTVARI